MKNNTLLCNGRSVHPDLLNLIHEVVTDRIPSLPSGTGLTLKIICGKDFWKCLTPGEQKTAGQCMVHLVTKGELPFIFAESRHEYPKFYQLK